jgi:hypothetical protein
MAEQLLAKRRAGRVQVVPDARKGTGQFREVTQVQDPNAAIVLGLLDSLSGPPAMRLAKPTGRRLFRGTAITPQRFIAPPSELNSLDQVRAGQVKLNARRSIGKNRGRRG